jgi:hypothetical protein
MASSSIGQEQVFMGPGLSLFKRIGTILGVVAVTSLVLWIAVYQHYTHNDASVIGSTVAAVLFIAGFVYYLGLVAPVPFTITVGPQMLIKRSSRGELVELRWDEVARVKEEFFPNRKRISVSVYRTVTDPGQKAKAWVVYRDDVTDLDGLAEALKQVMPTTCTWESEIVHE